MYTVTIFDLGVCFKAYPLIFTNPGKNKHHIIMLGTFHIACSYFTMEGKHINGTISGCVNGVMTDKHYTKALNLVMTESLECLLLG